MSLGMYICSFYFVQNAKKKKRRYVWDLHNEIKGEENCFSNALDFFQKFFESRKEPDDIEDDKRVYYIETKPEWQGEEEEFYYTMAKIYSGIYGVEADIYDKNVKKKVGKRGVNQADVMPFLFYVVIPKASGNSSYPVNKGIMIFQSISVYGIKMITTKLIKNYALSTVNSNFYTRNIAPKAFLEQLFSLGKLKSLILTKNVVSYDKSNSIEGVNFGREKRVYSQFAEFNKSKLFERLINFGMDKKSVFEWNDGTDFDSAKVQIKLPEGNIRTVDLHNFDNNSIIEIIPERYSKDNGHADEKLILDYFYGRAKEYLEQMSVSLNEV